MSRSRALLSRLGRSDGHPYASGRLADARDGSKHPYARAREGVTRNQQLLNRNGSIPSAKWEAFAVASVSSDQLASQSSVDCSSSSSRLGCAISSNRPDRE